MVLFNATPVSPLSTIFVYTGKGAFCCPPTVFSPTLPVHNAPHPPLLSSFSPSLYTLPHNVTLSLTFSSFDHYPLHFPLSFSSLSFILSSLSSPSHLYHLHLGLQSAALSGHKGIRIRMVQRGGGVTNSPERGPHPLLLFTQN